jgi:acyl-CoA dehydrogenase
MDGMFKVTEEHSMLRDLVKKFVRNELMPLERNILERFASGQPAALSDEENRKLFKQCKDLGLWALDVPEEVGGANLPATALVGVNEELGYTCVPFTFPPDSPNLHMLLATGQSRSSARSTSSPMRGRDDLGDRHLRAGAGGDPAGMKTKAVKDGDHWVINGRKIWISRIAKADFTIVMAVTDTNLGSRGGITAFLVDKGTPGLVIAAPSRCWRPAHLRGGVRGLPGAREPGAGPARARASRRCSCASPCAACRWARGASAWRSARST